MSFEFIKLKELSKNKENLALLASIIVASIELSTFISKVAHYISILVIVFAISLFYLKKINSHVLKYLIAVQLFVLASVWMNYIQGRGETFVGRSKILKRINRLVSASEIEIDKRINLLQRVQEKQYIPLPQVASKNDSSLIFYGSRRVFSLTNPKLLEISDARACEGTVSSLFSLIRVDFDNYLKQAGNFHSTDYEISKGLFVWKIRYSLGVFAGLSQACRNEPTTHYAIEFTKALVGIMEAKTEGEVLKAQSASGEIFKKLDNRLQVKLLKDSLNAPKFISQGIVHNGGTYYLGIDNLKDCRSLLENSVALLSYYYGLRYRDPMPPESKLDVVFHSIGIKLDKLMSKDSSYELTEPPHSSGNVICEGIHKNNLGLVQLREIKTI